MRRSSATSSSIRSAGAEVSDTPCQSLIMRWVPLPMPSTSRPLESSSRSRASVARTRGLRPTPYRMEDPIRQFCVRFASAAMEIDPER
ncbi:Uncharacterised protein [Mycobacteroides abscessus subsp. abscessus]|nr:Uncharacterised protein [Mycobacteroides abscessus subsp. abscessus]